MARRDKAWLKAVNDADLVEFFGDEEFDASEYAKGFYEKNQAAKAGARCEELETLKRQTEEALRQEVVRNYKTFMRATEQIQSMERDMERLKQLLGNTQDTLQAFQGVRLIETRPDRKDMTSPRPPGGHSSILGNDGRGDAPSKGLKLPQWLDRAPTELEELLLEQKHSEAVKLIQKVRDFAGNVRSATNLGQGVASIFSRVEEMAASLARRLVAEIAETATLTAWGFREHKRNFALLIALGHADEAAVAFVRERSALIRRSLRMAEVTADPLSYVTTVSETFFGQVVDSASAFLRLFCGSRREVERRAGRSRKSAEFLLALGGAKKCGTAPFCRLVVWVDQQMALYAALIGRQLRAVTLGAQVAHAEAEQRQLHYQQQQQQQQRRQTGDDPAQRLLLRSSMALRPGAVRLGPLASALFSMVSLMLEEAFAQAGRLSLLGFPVGVSLAARLAPDVAAFLDGYVQQVEGNLIDVIEKELFKPREYRLLPPEALQADPGAEDDEDSDEEIDGAGGGASNNQNDALVVTLTASASVMVREVRDVLDYSLVLLEPPPAPVEGGGGSGTAVIVGRRSGGGNAFGEEFDSEESTDGRPAAEGVSGDVAGNGGGSRSEPFYTRDDFLELQPIIVHSLVTLVRRYKEVVAAHVRRHSAPGGAKPRRVAAAGPAAAAAAAAAPPLTRDQVNAAGDCLLTLGKSFVPQLARWCRELLPEVMDEEEARVMEALAAELCDEGANMLATAPTTAHQ